MEGMQIRILILDRGFVKICYCPEPDGHIFWLPYINSRTIRIWGTTEGLGQLINGPTTDTRLDSIVFSGKTPVRSIIDTLDVDQDAWKPYLHHSSDASIPQTADQS